MICTAKLPLGFCWNRLFRDEQGSATIEFILWVPVIMALVLFAADVSLYFANTSRVSDTARDVTRRISLGQIQVSDAATYVAAHLPATFAPLVSVDETDPDDLTVDISVPYTAISPFGTIAAFRSGQFVFRYVMFREVPAGA